MAITTPAEFRQYIVDHLAVPIEELPVGRACAWFNNPVTGHPTLFEVDSPVPFDPFSGVMAIYQTPNLIKVYATPLQPPTPRPENWQDRTPTRYTLSRNAPTFVAEVMSWDLMAHLVVEEGNALANAGEFDLVIDYIEGKEPTINRDELLRELQEGAHLPEGDDDGEADEEADGEEAVPGAPPADPMKKPSQDGGKK